MTITVESGDPLATPTLTAEGEAGRRQDFAEQRHNTPPHTVDPEGLQQ
jgi:hypothetical protein